MRVSGTVKRIVIRGGVSIKNQYDIRANIILEYDGVQYVFNSPPAIVYWSDYGKRVIIESHACQWWKRNDSPHGVQCVVHRGEDICVEGKVRSKTQGYVYLTDVQFAKD